MTLLDTISQVRQRRRQENLADYDQLILAVAEGREVDPETAAEILDRTPAKNVGEGVRTETDLAADVTAYRTRRQQQAELDRLKAQLDRFPGLREKLANADAKLDKAKLQYDTIAGPLKQQIQQLGGLQSRVGKVAQELLNNGNDCASRPHQLAADRTISRAEFWSGASPMTIGSQRFSTSIRKGETGIFERVEHRLQELRELLAENQRELAEFPQRFEELERKRAELRERMVYC